MIKYLKVAGAFAALSLAPMASHAATEYVRVCSAFGAGFFYIPGTEDCTNPMTGDTRTATEGGVWRTILPYPEGNWTKNPRDECVGEVRNVGTFTAASFLPNAYRRGETAPIPFPLKPGEFISRIVMSGGFYDPRTPNRHASNSNNGICVRSIDPTSMQNNGERIVNPPYGNGLLPIGCIANSRLVDMNTSYSIAATSAYPSLDSYPLPDGLSNGPYRYGTQLVVTTDQANSRPEDLMRYFDGTTSHLLAGSVTVSACVQPASGPGR